LRERKHVGSTRLRSDVGASSLKGKRGARFLKDVLQGGSIKRPLQSLLWKCFFLLLKGEREGESAILIRGEKEGGEARQQHSFIASPLQLQGRKNPGTSGAGKRKLQSTSLLIFLRKSSTYWEKREGKGLSSPIKERDKKINL